ncbi:MAG: hypothetical protein ACJATT_005873, partial [Myxococcota bacterium]
GNAADNLSRLRHFALTLLKTEPTRKIGVRPSRWRAGWDNDYLLHIIGVRSGPIISTRQGAKPILSFDRLVPPLRGVSPVAGRRPLDLPSPSDHRRDRERVQRARRLRLKPEAILLLARHRIVYGPVTRTPHEHA